MFGAVYLLPNTFHFTNSLGYRQEFFFVSNLPVTNNLCKNLLAVVTSRRFRPVFALTRYETLVATVSPSFGVVSSATRFAFGRKPRGAASIFGLMTLLGRCGSGSAAVNNDKKINFCYRSSHRMLSTYLNLVLAH